MPIKFLKECWSSSESIRKCAQKNLEEWREYYFDNLGSKEYIIELGKTLLFR
ncbi:MAG: MjaI family restriction endonuclease [Paludibacteraceae bacterium]|nr:MjaI family restriction endonuclease [Paludibacteraceae bacterium]